MNLYTEFNNSVVKPLQISKFRSRFVTKKYPFNPEIPLESEYMEVRYPVSKNLKKSNKHYLNNTISVW